MGEPRQAPRWLSTGWPHLAVMGTPEIEILEILDHSGLFLKPQPQHSPLPRAAAVNKLVSVGTSLNTSGSLRPSQAIGRRRLRPSLPVLPLHLLLAKVS